MKSQKIDRKQKSGSFRRILSNRKIAIPAFSILGLAVASAAVLAALAILRPNVIALYDVDEASAQAVKTLAAEITASGGGKWTVEDLPSDGGLSTYLTGTHRPDLVVARDGAALSSIGKDLLPIPDELVAKIPWAQRQAGTERDRRYAVALQFDHFEMAYLANFPETQTLSDLLSSAKKLASAQFWPFACAGADDESLLALVSALAESEGGLARWQAVSADLAAGKPVEATALKPFLDELVRWQKLGLLHPEWLRHQPGDVAALMKGKFTAFAFISLSDHRNIPFKTISQFKSQRFPATAMARTRSLIAEATVAAIPASSRNAKAARAFIAQALTPESQKTLTWASGLSPVHPSMQCRDLQGTEARFWVASCQRPLPQLGRGSFPDKSAQRALAKAVREYIVTETAKQP